jgi:hypothetical protein
MRVAKMLTLLFDAVGGAWMALLGVGIYVDVTGQTRNGYYLTFPPSHPFIHIFLYLTVAVGLQAVSAWILMPATPGTSTAAYWGRYAATVVACLCGPAVAGALLLAVLLFLCTDC